MSFLGSLGSALGWVGKLVGYVPTVISLVETIGKIFKLTGQQKQDAVVAAVREAILAGEFFSGKEIADEDAFEANLKTTIDGIVGMMNATTWKK